jgi:hypothetical protein
MDDQYVAIERLRWGDGDIMPGEPVPGGEQGRDYAGLLLHGHIARVGAPEFPDEAAREAFERLAGERDKLAKQVADLEAERDELAALVEQATSGDATEPEAASAPDDPPDALPDGVKDLGGGWYQLADESKVHGRAALAKALTE